MNSIRPEKRNRTVKLAAEPSLQGLMGRVVFAIIVGLAASSVGIDAASRRNVLILGIALLFLYSCYNLVWAHYHSRRISKCSLLMGISLKLGVGVGDLERIAEERQIKPRYNIAGTDLYGLEDFADSARLLRPTGSPIDETRSLRAAFQQERPEEILVRPAESRVE